MLQICFFSTIVLGPDDRHPIHWERCVGTLERSHVYSCSRGSSQKYGWFMDGLWMIYGWFIDGFWTVYGWFMTSIFTRKWQSDSRLTSHWVWSAPKNWCAKKMVERPFLLLQNLATLLTSLNYLRFYCFRWTWNKENDDPPVTELVEGDLVHGNSTCI